MTLPIQPMTLCYIREGNKILLAKKKRDFSKGKWNGYGGKVGNVIKDESVEQALIREMKEESGVDILEFEKRGEITFRYKDHISLTHVYEIMRYSGEIIETEEMSPSWFEINKLPWDEMWEDDQTWMPYFLKKIYFLGEGDFDDNYNLLSFKIKEV